MNLFPDQIQAVEMACNNRVSILTGSAGTGKSTTVKAILEKLAKPGLRVHLAAPSGKAARRLWDVTGHQAQTIHRLLEPEKVGESFIFTRNRTNPIEADVVILDEVSMVDVSLMARFMESVMPETKLVFVGDPYQLSSVGPGNVLKDLIDSKTFPAVELTIIKRQDEGLIIKNCHHIKNGEDILVDNKEDGDFFFFERREENEIQEKILDLVCRSLPKAKNLDPLRDIQVLSPFREKTSLSCKVLNERLQAILNPHPVVEGLRFRIGDKVIQLRNDYDLGIVNGDVGYVREIDRPEKKIRVMFENPDRLVEINLFENDLDLAYCMTVHKSQGSEWPVVVMPIHKSFGSLLMNRNLLYTAVSRARNFCFLVGHRDDVPRIISRNNALRRFTGLAQFLNGKG